jgi:ABC-type sugar transport system permease subunit
MKGKTLRENRFVLFMVFPSFLIYCLFYLYPGLQAFKVSTYDWNGFNPDTIKKIGLGNYRTLIKDEVFWNALQNNLLIIVFGGIAVVVLGLMFANFLTKNRVIGKSFFRSMIFFPYSVSIVAIGIVWTFVLNPSFGLVNAFLTFLGKDAEGIAWLGGRTTAMAWIIFVTVWWWVGFFMTLMIAGIQRIPDEYFEAARIDGASDSQVFFKVTLPLLQEVLGIGITYWIINGWMSFGVVYVMTQGGPSNRTQTIATYMVWMSVNYVNAAYKMGYGTAIAVVLFFIVVVFTIMSKLFTRKEPIQY